MIFAALKQAVMIEMLIFHSEPNDTFCYMLKCCMCDGVRLVLIEPESFNRLYSFDDVHCIKGKLNKITNNGLRNKYSTRFYLRHARKYGKSGLKVGSFILAKSLKPYDDI